MDEPDGYEAEEEEELQQEEGIILTGGHAEDSFSWRS
jgi:hypothetical protein